MKYRILSLASWKYQKHPFPLEDSSPKSVYSPDYPPRSILGQQNPAFFVVFFFSIFFLPLEHNRPKQPHYINTTGKRQTCGASKPREREREGQGYCFFYSCNGEEDMVVEEGYDEEGSAVAMENLWHQMETWS